MEFSVLNKQTVQCIMTGAEIADYGMDKQALFQNDGRVQEFFRQIMQQAEQETGFRKEQGNVAVHASFLSDESLAITFSAGCKNPLLQNAAEGSTREKGRYKSKAAGNAVYSISTVILKSKNFDHMLRFCAQAPKALKASLYQYKGVYFLLADICDYQPLQTAMLFNLADEYLDAVCYTPGIVAFLREHGTCVIAERAIGILGDL